MNTLLDNPQGNYRFLEGIAPYSSGVVAMPGHEIVHVIIQEPPPYRKGFELVERHLTERGRSRAALCAIQLRIPEALPFDGFAEFNQDYRALLEDWNLLVDDQNPVARTNVAPAVRPPAEPVLYAFSYTVPSSDANLPLTFVVAGAGELAGASLSPQDVIRAGETTVEAMRDKAAHVIGTMEARLLGLGGAWSGVTCVDIYTVYPIHAFLARTILERMGPAAVHSIHWFLSRPPIDALDFEMDMRGVRQEIRL
jgi:hypothetical protein